MHFILRNFSTESRLSCCIVIKEFYLTKLFCNNHGSPLWRASTSSVHIFFDSRCVLSLLPAYFPFRLLLIIIITLYVTGPQIIFSILNQGCGVGGKMSHSDLSKISDSDSLTWSEWSSAVDNFAATSTQWKSWYTAIICFKFQNKLYHFKQGCGGVGGERSASNSLTSREWNPVVTFDGNRGTQQETSDSTKVSKEIVPFQQEFPI